MIAGELAGPCTLSSMLALLHVLSTSHNTSVSPPQAQASSRAQINAYSNNFYKCFSGYCIQLP